MHLGAGQLVELREVNGVKAAYLLGRYLHNPIRQSERIYARYGPAVKIGRRIIHAVGSELSKEIFSKPDVFLGSSFFVKGPVGTAHDRVRSNYFAAKHDEYYHYQKQFRPFFKRKETDNALVSISNVVGEEIKHWPRNKVTDFVPHVKKIARRMALVSLFKEDENPIAIKASTEMIKMVDLGHFSWRNITKTPYPGSHYKKMLAQAEVTERAVAEWAETRRDMCPQSDIMSSVVNNQDETGCPAAKGRIAAYIVNLYGASYETTSSIVASSCALFARFPQSMHRIRQETSGLDLNKQDDLEKLMKLPYLEWFSQEALRILPPGPVQRRKAFIDTTLGGNDIEEQTTVLISTWQTNRLPELYDEPHKFRPERWDGLNNSPYEFLTFSAGPRRCSGIWFGYAYLKLFLAHMAREGDMVAEKGAKLDLAFKITMMPKNGLHLKFLEPSDQPRAPSMIGGSFGRAVH